MHSDIKPSISIIIVSYNCLDFVIEAVQSIQQFIEIPYEIIIVDNASTDKTTEVVPGLDANIHFIANKQNVGFSAANNQGFALSKGHTILLLNPDAKLINKDISKALAALDKNSNSIIGPKILNPDLSLQHSVLAMPSVKSIFLETFFLSYFSKPSIHPTSFGLSGACLLMKREVFEKLNGLDENLFWMDDVDFCFRAQQQNIRCMYFEDWEIVHVIGQSTKKNYKVAISNQLVSKLKFFKKHRQWFNFILSVLLTQIQIIFRIPLFIFLSPFKSIYWQKFKAYCHSQIKLFLYLLGSKSLK